MEEGERRGRGEERKGREREGKEMGEKRSR